MNGAVLMIRVLIFVVLFISSCVSFPLYNDALSYVKIAFRAQDYPDKKVIEASPYALLGAELGNSKVALVLAYDRDGFLEWVSASNESLVTFNGKLIQSAGLENDFRITNPPDFESIKNTLLNQNVIAEWSSFVSFSDPILNMAPIKFRYSVSNVIYSDQDIKQESIMITEFFTVPSIKWRGTNFYWYNLNGSFIASKQETSPSVKLRLKSLKPYKQT